jgi:hypothetical protein
LTIAVAANFSRFVPAFADFGNGMVRLGLVVMFGNSARTVELVFDRQPKKVELSAQKEVLDS